MNKAKLHTNPTNTALKCFEISSSGLLLRSPATKFALHISTQFMAVPLVGFGYDVHRLASGESLILGGVRLESEIGTVAHSDGDVLLHALCDALLGAAGLGDIGEHFPDTDLKWKDADSSVFVRECRSMLEARQLQIVNVDMALVLEAPRLKKYKPAMRSHIATLLGLNEQRVNIKATTSEKLGFVGAGQGIQAYCVCSVIDNATSV